MSPTSVRKVAEITSSIPEIATAAATPPRTPKESAHASTAPGVQIEPITGASAAIWAGLCTSSVVTMIPAVTARSATASRPRPSRASGSAPKPSVRGEPAAPT